MAGADGGPLGWRLRRVASVRPHQAVGTITDVVGLTVEIAGLDAAIGDVLRTVGERAGVPGGASSTPSLEFEVVGFRAGRLIATPLGSIAGARPGARVTHAERGSVVPVGDALLGRVIDAFGAPLDGKPAADCSDGYPIHAPPPAPMLRRPIEEQFLSGVRAIDGMLALGCGQRIGIFAGSGVGKTTLLGILCRRSAADVNVVGLVGERGREVNDFLRTALGAEGLARSVVVVATSDQPPPVRARGAETATAIAEYFRDQGKSVLLVMDSVTRYAMALRETALATGEPPATKGYPPSVFAALPRLLERAGTGPSRGSVTALYTVLVEGDDLNDPIADAVRGILDGHIVLSRRLAERGHFPAIDVLASISRLAPVVASPDDQRSATAVRDLMAVYAEAADLIQVGAYAPGSDPRVDAACRALAPIESFLRQDAQQVAPMDKTRADMALLAAMRGAA